MKREGAVSVAVHERAKRRRRDTPSTVKIAPISMADIAAAFAEAMKTKT